MIKNWKNLLVKYFDFNQNKNIEWWEVTLFVSIFIMFELIIGVLSNYIYSIL
jgi:hypothetical protein